jgi:hypothetical protein
MKRVVFLVAIVLAPVLLAAAGVCGAQAAPAFQFDGPEGCCAVSHCSLLAMGVLGVGFWGDVTTPPSVTAVLARSTTQQPVSPPPELLALRSA